MATCTELYIDTLGGLDLDGSTDKNLQYFVVENLATLDYRRKQPYLIVSRAGKTQVFKKSFL